MATLAQRGAGTPATTGTTWTTVTNAVDGAAGTNPATYAVWTSVTSGAVATLEVTGYDFAAIADTSTLNSVTVQLRHFENNITRIASVTFQAYAGATPLGSAATATRSLSAVTDQATFPVTLAQLKAGTFKVRTTATRAAVTQSATFNVDHLDVVADYTPAGVVVTGTATATVATAATAAGTVEAPPAPVTGSRTSEAGLQRNLEDVTARLLETVAAVPVVTGTGQTTIAVTVVATGQVVAEVVSGTAVAALGVLAAAQGVRVARGTATATVGVAVTAAGTRFGAGTGTAQVGVAVAVAAVGRRIVAATATATVTVTVAATGQTIVVGEIRGWWNGQETVAMQWGDVPVVDWQLT